MTDSVSKKCDIVIVGGGIAGLTLAAVLRESNFSVALVEHKTLPELSTQPELRVSAIGRAAMQVFERCGAASAMLASRATPFREMHVWDSTGAGEIHFDSAEMGLETLGYIMENNRIQHALFDVVQQADNIEMFCPASVESIQREQPGFILQLDNGETLQCQLLVGADGVQSKVRQFAAIEFNPKSYQQKALVCTVTTEYDHQNTAWQIFLPSGPLAFLPMFTHADRHQCSIVWSLPDDEAERLLSTDEKSFISELETAFQFRLGAIELVTERATFPLQHGHVNHYVQDGLALIGDAAHIIHPLAGQGANLGILDAQQLATALIEARQADRQWWARHTLRVYERSRKGENMAMETAMSGFNTLFANDNAWLALLRNAGLNLIDHAPFIKQQFMRQVTGARDEVQGARKTI
jgi:2-octaprenylphenol hydroxylase